MISSQAVAVATITTVRQYIVLMSLILLCVSQQTSAFQVVQKDNSYSRQNNKSPKGVCGYEDRFNCAKDRKSETLNFEALYTCEACGNLWSNVVGMAWCCRCNPKVFAFCWEKVHDQALIAK